MRVAYSGGLDSHVLLHTLHAIADQLDCSLEAIHVNHSLHPDAVIWATHCRSVCDRLGVAMTLIVLDATAPKGESPEAWARQLRYQVLEESLAEHDVLLTAHHQDDMAETVLLQLFRGAGPAGLAAIRQHSRLGKGWLLRPMLDFNRKQLRDYATRQRLEWIEDGSNTDQKFDRNYLRNTIMPLIRQRWQGIATTLGRAALHQADAALLLDDVAAQDYLRCRVGGTRYLDARVLDGLSPVRVRNLIRYWLREQGHPVPTCRQMQHILDDVLHAGADASPCVHWNETEVRRYRHYVSVSRPLPAPAVRQLPVDWDLHQPCRLALGELNAVQSTEAGIRLGACHGDNTTIRYRCGGEVLKQGGHHRPLNKLFQENGIAPWFRDFVPLVYIDNQLAAVPGIGIDAAFQSENGDAAWQIHWSETDRVRFP